MSDVLFPFSWPMLPPSVYPPILARVLPYEFFDSFGVLGCYPPKRVVLVSPFLRQDNACSTDLKIKTVVNSPAVSDYNGNVVSDR